MSDMGEYEITAAMMTYGGGFVSALGSLIRRADEDNKRRLVAAFPEYIAEYRDIARRMKGLRASLAARPVEE